MPTPHEFDRAATDAEIERGAYNAAFYELGLRWHWDEDTYEHLAAEPCERARVRRYVQTTQPHLLSAYDADFLADAVIQAKQRCRRSLAQCASQAMLHRNWADPRWGEVGI